MNNFDEILENLAINQKKTVPELSGFEKQRVLSRTMAKINPERAVRRVKFGRAALICAVCVTLAASAAAAGYFRLDEMFYRYLLGSDTNVEVAGESIAAQATADGITVTARQVIGDDYGFYVIFDVSPGSAKEIEVDEVEIRGAKVYQCSDIIGMQGEKLSTFMLHIMSAENLQGKKIFVHFSGADNAKWSLNWKIDYSSSAKSFDVSRQVGIYGGSALWKSVSLSPVSVSVKLTDLAGTKKYCGDPNDSITVTMDDGSVFSSAAGEDTDIMHDTDFITMSFNRIIDISKVKSISFAGEIYEIN